MAAASGTPMPRRSLVRSLSKGLLNSASLLLAPHTSNSHSKSKDQEHSIDSLSVEKEDVIAKGKQRSSVSADNSSSGPAGSERKKVSMLVKTLTHHINITGDTSDSEDEYDEYEDGVPELMSVKPVKPDAPPPHLRAATVGGGFAGIGATAAMLMGSSMLPEEMQPVQEEREFEQDTCDIVRPPGRRYSIGSCHLASMTRQLTDDANRINGNISFTLEGAAALSTLTSAHRQVRRAFLGWKIWLEAKHAAKFRYRVYCARVRKYRKTNVGVKMLEWCARANMRFSTSLGSRHLSSLSPLLVPPQKEGAPAVKAQRTLQEMRLFTKHLDDVQIEIPRSVQAQCWIDATSIIEDLIKTYSTQLGPTASLTIQARQRQQQLKVKIIDAGMRKEPGKIH